MRRRIRLPQTVLPFAKFRLYQVRRKQPHSIRAQRPAGDGLNEGKLTEGALSAPAALWKKGLG
jgi:hypothetical protein